MPDTKIPYCTKTWNPIEGCRACSPGCDRCWAKKWANRAQHNPVFRRNGDDMKYSCIAAWSGTLAEFPSRWSDPLRWRKPQRIFVGSRSDVALWPVEKLCYLFAILDQTKWHRYLMLTKRPAMLAQKLGEIRALPGNMLLGVTVCSQEEADEKIPQLLKIPAAGYWLSVEPMLGQVVVPDDVLCQDPYCGHARVSWVVCGGESGKGARPIRPDWVRSLRDQCQSAGVPFWFKQWSSGAAYHLFDNHKDSWSWRLGAATIDGQVWHNFPSALLLPGEV